MKPPDLPADKIYFTIGEVAEIFNVKTSLIRYWEQEFKQLHPHKNRKGDRRYIKKDINTLHSIYTLVKEKGYTLDGAKKALAEGEGRNEEEKRFLMEKLHDIKAELLILKSKLSQLR